MATFEEKIESMTQITVSSSDTSPVQSEVTDFLNEGIKDFTNKFINLRPDEAFKFASETTITDDSGVLVTGRILSVERENTPTNADGSVSFKRIYPATEIPASIRYNATDKSSLHYRSLYNPCFYKLNGRLYVLPVPAVDSYGNPKNQAVISQISYASTLYNSTIINAFPDEYEHIIVLYAAAKSCQSAAANIQNNMPTVPTAPVVTGFDDITDITLPDMPVYVPSKLDISLSKMSSFITSQDIDLVDKQESIVSKEYDFFKTKNDMSVKEYEKDLAVFNSDLETLNKNMDRVAQKAVNEYRAKVYKYQYEINQYSQELQEKMVKYKWFLEQYIYFMNEYNQSIQLSLAPKKAPKQAAIKEPQQQEEEGGQEAYGA